MNVRQQIRRIIFEADTPSGKAFDLLLLIAIVASVAAVLLASLPDLAEGQMEWLRVAEWFFTVLFTIEYVARLWCVNSPRHYARSFYGIIDLLAIVPTYLSLLFPGAEFLLVVRLIRVLRVFRVLKLLQFVDGGDIIRRALMASRYKVAVFLVAVLSLVTIIGAVIYLVEGEAGGFDSIPRGIYWAIVTLTTVGYGDISPRTPLGQIIASLVMICGYAIIAVPTGIVTAEMVYARGPRQIDTRACPNCAAEEHAEDAAFCRICGGKLEKSGAAS